MESLRPMMAYDHDPLALAEGRVPMRRGQPLVFASDAVAPSPRPLKGYSVPTPNPGDVDVDAEVKSKLLSYLADVLVSDQIEAVKAIMDGQEVAPATASGPAMDAIIKRKVAAHRASGAVAFDARYPGADRLKSA